MNINENTHLLSYFYFSFLTCSLEKNNVRVKERIHELIDITFGFRGDFVSGIFVLFIIFVIVFCL